MIAPLYRAATWLAGPLLTALLRARMTRGKEDPARLGERMGRAGAARPLGVLVWIHAASVGEAQSVLALLARVAAERPHLSLLLTTGTLSSARLVAGRLPPRTLHQFVPLDRASWVRAFLDHWQPDLALWVESELWPNLVLETRAREIPMALLNGRMSPTSHAAWRRAPGFARRLLSCFELAFAQSRAEAERFRELGAPRVETVGNLKYAAEMLPADARALAALGQAMGARPRWLAASTHAGEDEPVLAAHRTLATHHPDLLTIIAPRHPARADAIVQLAQAQGLHVARRSAGETPDAQTQLYLADTMGELGLFYRLCPVVFMGGSLVPHGGQNLLEAARHGAAILHGPHMHNFAEIVAEMAGVTETVADGAALARAAERLLSDASLRARRGAEARAVADAQRGVLDRVMATLAPLLDRLPQGSAR